MLAYHNFITLIVVCFFSANSLAFNELRELEYAEKIEASLAIGKILWLQVKGTKFLALYTETEEIENLGTAILLHPMGGHPDQKKIINPLRTYLPEHRWATLSLQMPVLGIGAKENEYYPIFDNANARIQAAIDYLVAAKVNNIVLVGYGVGGMMAMYYLNEHTNKKEVKALVAISIGVPETEQKQVQVIDFISGVKQPILDIFAEFDLPEVTMSARERRIAGKENLAYRQFKVEGEGHLFEHDEGLVMKRIYSWINLIFR